MTRRIKVQRGRWDAPNSGCLEKTHVILGDQISDPPPPDDPLEFHDASETKKFATGTDQQQLVSNGL